MHLIGTAKSNDTNLTDRWSFAGISPLFSDKHISKNKSTPPVVIASEEVDKKMKQYIQRNDLTRKLDPLRNNVSTTQTTQIGNRGILKGGRSSNTELAHSPTANQIEDDEGEKSEDDIEEYETLSYDVYI